MGGGNETFSFVLEEQLTRKDNVEVAFVIILFHDGVFGVPRRVVEIENHEREEIEPTSGTVFAIYGVDDCMPLCHMGVSVRSQRNAPWVLTVSRSASKVLLNTSFTACVCTSHATMGTILSTDMSAQAVLRVVKFAELVD